MRMPKSGRPVIGATGIRTTGIRAMLIPAAAAVVVGLAGCGGGESDSTPPSSSTPDAAKASPLQGDQLYLAGLKQLNVRFPDDAAAVAAGKQVCANLKAGDGLLDAILKVGNGLDDAESGQVVGLAAQTYCPDQLGKLSGVQSES